MLHRSVAVVGCVQLGVRSFFLVVVVPLSVHIAFVAGHTAQWYTLT